MGLHRTGILVAISLLFFPSGAFAHADLSEYVQHEATLDAHGEYIDITLQLTFFDELAEARRRSLDRDGNGDISPEEQTALKKALLLEAEKAIVLQADGTGVELVSRFDPEIECAVPGSGGAHLRFVIRLHFFAERPPLPAGGVSLELTDGLLGDIPAMASLRVTGKDGLSISAIDEAREHSRTAGAPASLIFKAHLEKHEKAARNNREIPGRRKKGE